MFVMRASVEPFGAPWGERDRRYAAAMDSPTTAGERDQLERFLDEARAEARATLAGLTEEQARRRLVPSLTTPIGLITHLTFVEKIWFQVVLAGRTRKELGLPTTVDPSFIPDDSD